MNATQTYIAQLESAVAVQREALAEQRRAIDALHACVRALELECGVNEPRETRVERLARAVLARR